MSESINENEGREWAVHDALVKAVFRVPLCFALLLRLAIPGWLLDLLDLATLREEPSEHAAEVFDRGQTDLLFSVDLRDGSGSMVFLLEHRSTPQRDCVLRFWRYEQLIWYRAGRLVSPLPVVVPILMFQGPGRWTEPRTLRELLHVPAGLSKALATPDLDTRIVPDQVPAIVELGCWNLEDLISIPEPAPALARLALVALKADRERLDWVSVFRRAESLVRELTRDDPIGYAEICRYIEEVGQAEVVMKLEDDVRSLHGEAAARPFRTAAEHHRDEGREEGREEGRVSARGILMKLLQLRFGSLSPETLKRVDAGSLDQLQRWAEVAGSAATQEDVFGGR